jgi:hypothetical protein
MSDVTFLSLVFCFFFLMFTFAWLCDRLTEK